MKVFLVSRSETASWDEYDSFVVIAETAEDARMTHPNGTKDKPGDEGRCTWPVNPLALIVEEIGTSRDDLKAGVVLASFNAG